MKNLVLFPIWLFSICISYSQKHDYVWLLGYYGQNYSPNLGGFKIDFNYEPLQIKEIDTNFSFQSTVAGVSDKLGQLLLYTNGITVINNYFNIIENGDSLNPDGISLDYYKFGLNVNQGAIILPHPSNDSLFFIFHMPIDWNIQINSHIPKLYFSLVNVYKSEGNPAIIDKNHLLIEDTLIWGKLTATRHANGSDWWVITGERDTFTNVIYKLLLTSNGIENIERVEVSPSIFYDAPSIGNAIFTPDGTKYIRHDIRFDPWNVIDIYDFDRCSGEFYFKEHIELSDTSFLYGGSAVSPDSRYLYASTNNRVFQFDLTAPNIEATKTKVAEFDGYVAFWFPSYFGTPQLGPNGKIYIASAVGDTVMHVINSPNQPGLASHLAQHSINLPNLNDKSIPNFPNYRLGPLDGSPCDTLGLDNHPKAGFTYFAEELAVTFSDNSYYRPEEWEWDFGDGSGSTERNPITAYDAPGEYYVCLTVRNEIDEDTYCRYIQVDTMMVVGVLEPGKTGKVAVFPNPASGQFNLQFDLPGTDKVAFSLHDVAGRKVKAWDLPGGKGYFTLPLFGVAEGMYFWRVALGGRFLGSGKLIVSK